MSKITKEWAKAAAVRAVKTFAQTTIAAIGTEAVSIGSVTWPEIGAAALTGLLAGALSLLMSLGGLPEVEETKEG